MPLPDREYFTLDEIARRWEVPPANVERYAKTEKLEVCVHLLPVDAEGGTYDELGSVPNFQDRLKRGCYPIDPEDLWTVLRQGEVKTSQLKPYEGHTYLTIAKEITVTRDELVVTRAELERFETAYEVPADVDKPGPSAIEKPEPDPYKSGAPGRPSAMHLVESEFHRRAKAGECLGSLKDEAEALLDLKEKNHPKAPRLTANTIKNRIRKPYNELVRNQPPK